MVPPPTAISSPILGFDPGRDKCGIAIRDANGMIQEHQVVVAAEAIATLLHLYQRYGFTQVVMGDQTTAKQWQTQLQAALPETVAIALVDERNSTLEARDRYWQMYPPRGWQSLVPQSLRPIPRPIDDIVAILLIERYLYWRLSP